MVISNKHYPEGQTHVIPLLFLALPGLDPNDIKKCMITFQFISTFVSLIPLVDCSSAVEFRKDLAQTEYDVCLATSQWEDFVFQFIERCFLLIENSSFEHRPERRESEAFRINSEEGMTELGLTSSFNSILNQCSPQIFERALDKVYCYLSNRIFEEKVSGKFAANICRCFTKVNPELTLKKFWPHFSKQVLHLTESDDVLHEDHLDQQLVFNLLVLSEIVRCDGHHLLNYKDSIVQVLRRTLLLKSRYGYILACSLLHYTLKSLAFLYPLDYRSIPQSWIELSNFNHDLPIHYWGKAGDKKTLNIKWHEPSDDEIHFAQLLLDEEWVAGNKQMCKEESIKSLTIIFDCLSGVSSALPIWKMEKYDLPESCDPRLQ
ncbi:proteasome activator complex subunit 4-like protein, partial [Dinothrombium tinctorium]